MKKANVSQGREHFESRAREILALPSGKLHKSVLSILRENERLKRAAKRFERLKLLNELDPMTELLHFRSFQARLIKYLMYPQRNAPTEMFAVLLMIDINKLKSINDEYGHYAGDLAIKHISARLKKYTRFNPFEMEFEDFVARRGGDEFLVFMRMHATPEFWLKLSELTSHLVEIDEDVQGRKVPHQLRTLLLPRVTEESASVGIPYLSASTGELFMAEKPIRRTYMQAKHLAKALIDRADKLMYEAKRSPKQGGLYRSRFERVELTVEGFYQVPMF